MCKGHRSQPKRVPNDQSLNNLNSKITVALNLDPKNKINIHESVLI